MYIQVDAYEILRFILNIKPNLASAHLEALV